MKKTFLRGLLTLSIIIAAGAMFIMTSNDAKACKKCDTRPSSRKCGECDSSRLFDDDCWTASNGRIRTHWTCIDCTHAFTTELRNGKEVVLTQKELDDESKEKPEKMPPKEPETE